MTETLTERTTDTLERREFVIRAVDTDTRTVTGIAVPFDQEVRIAGWFDDYFESVAPGACEAREGEPKAFWLHRQIVGKATTYRDTDEGWEVSLRISETPTGDEVYTLAKDGVVDRMSIGFEPVEHTETVDDDGRKHIRRTRINVREVSLVPFPAYDGAKVSDVRSATPTQKETPVTVTMTETEAAQLRTDLDQNRSDLDEMRRAFTELINANRDAAPAVHYRTAGHLLKALARGDAAAIKEYNDVIARAWDPAGAVVANGTRPGAGWVGDLTRIVDEAAVLASLFSDGSLPAEGMTIEYAELLSNTVQVTQQAAEGDDLAFGKVSTEVKNAAIKTYGGYSRLSVQAIERASVNLLNHTITAIGIAAGKRRNTVYRAVFAAAVAAQVTAGNTVEVEDSTDYKSWLDAIIDAAEKYTDLGLALDALVVDKTVFKSLAHLEGGDGRPLLTISGTGTNVVGDLNVTAIQGNLASVPVRLNPKQTLPGASFINRLAIREYRSPLARLQDENVVNLSKDFSAYFYAAHAVEIPAAIVPVEITA